MIPNSGTLLAEKCPCTWVSLEPQDSTITGSTNAGRLMFNGLEIADGDIVQIITADGCDTGETPSVNLRGGQVWPCFVDMHTHLDKGHIWTRSPNPDGTFDSALEAAKIDSEQYWQAEDVYRRMEFGLKCSYAHGTQAIRTHIDSFGQQAEISLEVFKALQKAWCDRLILQAVSLVTI
jgi:cytosine deaminase